MTDIRFSTARLARLADMDRYHFWAISRRELIQGLIAKDVPHAPHAAAVDVGCGSGAKLAWLEKAGFRTLGLDGHHEMLRALDGRFSTVQANATALPIAADQVDLVLLLDVIEHLDDQAALAEAARILHTGGFLVVSVPAFQALWSRRDEGAGHLRRYSRRLLMDRLNAAGFEVERVTGFQALLFPLVVLSRLTGRRSNTARDREDSGGGLLNPLFLWINRLEVRLTLLGIHWGFGSSFVAVARKTPKSHRPSEIR